MAKLSVQVGYRNYVLDGEKALQVLDILQGAELYEVKWRNEADGGTTQHIYPQDVTSSKVEVTYLTDEQYRMYKLAGKPSE
jgi:predicted DNA-binding ArsR family transcriptional regulator